MTRVKAGNKRAVCADSNSKWAAQCCPLFTGTMMKDFTVKMFWCDTASAENRYVTVSPATITDAIIRRQLQSALSRVVAEDDVALTVLRARIRRELRQAQEETSDAVAVTRESQCRPEEFGAEHRNCCAMQPENGQIAEEHNQRKYE